MPKPYHPVREDRRYLPSIRRVRRIVMWGLSTVFFFRDQRFKLSHLKLENERPAVVVLAQNVTGKMSDAFQRLSVSIASYRPGDAANQKILNVTSPPKTCGLSVALYLQVGDGELWSDMLSCAANVVYGSKVSGCKNVDVFVSLVDARVPFLSVQTVRNELLTLRDVGKVVVKKFDNLGADIGAFLQMLHQQREETSDEYDIILKMHSKGDSIWRERGIESLCGTPQQVVSIIKQFQGDGQLDMIAPQGTVIGPDTDASRVFPHIVRKYGLGVTRSVSEVFRDNVLQMEDTFRQLFPNGFRGEGPRSIKNHELAICAGTMFWARWGALHVNALVREFPTLKVNLTTEYMVNGDGGLEHTIELIFTTLIVMQNRRIGTIPPAPRPLAIYFPQYHAIPENDRFWGEGFTEWTLLRPLEVEGIRKPLSVEEGGLGYYDLMSRSIRRKQADFARKFGVNGFIFYHYWFSGSYAPDDHLVMHQVQERMLLDGEPDLPFAFSWANEPWSKRWTGEDKEILLSQEYGTEDEWRDHFNYLLTFFRHPNYIRQDGRPLFFLYRIGHIGLKLQPMLDLWRKLAIDAGLPGIHFVNTIGGFRHADKLTTQVEKDARIDAAFHFWPHLRHSHYHFEKVLKSNSGSISDLSDVSLPTQYWGSWTGFDNRPRVPHGTPEHISTDHFGDGLACSFLSMAQQTSREVQKNFYVITAWNEWNEQAVLEPDDHNGFGYLETLEKALENVPIEYVYREASARDGDEDMEKIAILKKCL